MIKCCLFVMLMFVTGLTGCDECDHHQRRGDYILEMCGPKPTTPGIVAYFDGNDRAILSTQNYIEIRNALDQLSNWSFCAAELD